MSRNADTLKKLIDRYIKIGEQNGGITLQEGIGLTSVLALTMILDELEKINGEKCEEVSKPNENEKTP